MTQHKTKSADEMQELARRRVRTLILIAFCASTLPVVLQAFTGGRSAAIVAAAAPQSGVASAAAQGLTALLLIVSVVGMCFSGSRSVIKSHRGLLAALLPWVITVALTAVGQERMSLSSAAYPMLVLAFWFLGARIADLSLVGKAALWVAAGSMALGLFLPSIGLVAGYQGQFVTAEKAIIDAPLLAGPYAHSNSLGGVLAMAGICALLLPPRLRTATILVVAGALVWSASRTGLYALGGALLVALILRLLRAGARRLAAIVAVLAAGVMVVALPLTNTTLHSYSDRGQIWIGSLNAWEDHPWIGNGIGWYAEIAKINNVLLPQAFHGHNLFVHWLATGGILLVAAMTVFLLRVLKVASAEVRAGNNFAICYLFGFLIMAILEVNISFRDVTPTFWVMVIPLAAIVLQPTSSSPRNMHSRLILQAHMLREGPKALPSALREARLP